MTVGPSDPDYSARGPVLLGAVALVLLVGGLGTWSATVRISGAITAAGQVEIENDREVVQHPDGGVVAEIGVRDGDAVERGALLLRLDGALLQSELAIVEAQYFEILARRGRLEAERDDFPSIRFSPALTEAAAGNAGVSAMMAGQVRLLADRREVTAGQREQLGRQREQISSQIAGIAAQRAAVTTELDLLGDEISSLRSLLERGLAPRPRLLALEREQARLVGLSGELEAARAAAEEKLTEIAIQSLQVGIGLREEASSQLRDLGYREFELAERRRSLSERIRRLDIRAPASGVVHALQVKTPGAIVRPTETVLEVVPVGRPLIVAVRILPAEIDEVRVGQKAALRFTAFSGSSAPELAGLVSRISADTFFDERTDTPFFRAEIVVGDGQPEKLGAQRIRPGMPVEVFLRTEERTPLTYLIKPLRDHFRRAFRES